MLLIQMWQLLDSTDKCWSPVAVHRGHLSNIFSAAFSCTQRHIFSTGNDGLLLKYDVNRGASLVAASTASDVFVAHEEACFKVSTHPDNEALALTAGQDCK